MRWIVLLFVFFVVSDAAYLYKNKNLCVDDYYFDQSSRYLYYLPSDSDDYLSTRYSDQTFLTGYDYNETNDICAPVQVLRDLQITNEQYHFLIALIGVLTGFVLLFFVVYITIDVARK